MIPLTSGRQIWLDGSTHLSTAVSNSTSLLEIQRHLKIN